ncbi:hypothetical protein ABZ901_10875 [Actinacidiphila alni]|uniref:hypothetical protein n=1 Tax=Actinacidiphila alni TaxID=380248 RepID=UPI0033E322CD
MRTRLAITMLAAVAAGAFVTGCGAGSGAGPKVVYSSGAPRTSTPALASAIDPREWKSRITDTFRDVGRPDPDCTGHLSGRPCAEALRSIRQVMVDLRAALADSGESVAYPLTSDSINQALAGYATYVALKCQGDPEADAKESGCDAATSNVLMGATTAAVDLVIDSESRSAV